MKQLFPALTPSLRKAPIPKKRVLNLKIFKNDFDLFSPKSWINFGIIESLLSVLWGLMTKIFKHLIMLGLDVNLSDENYWQKFLVLWFRFVIYLSAICDDVLQGKKILNAAINALFSLPTPAETGEDSLEHQNDSAEMKEKPALLWSATYIQDLTMVFFYSSVYIYIYFSFLNT